MWRIKTEQEFIQEYGDNWKAKVYPGWNKKGSMDHLLGQAIDPMLAHDINKHRAFSSGRWKIGKDMITDLPKSANLYPIF